MAKIVDINNYPYRDFSDGKGGQWAITSAVAAEVGAKFCDVVLIIKKPGFTPLDILHYHPNREEFFVVLEGRAKALIDDSEVLLEPGMVVFVPAKEEHYLHLRAVPLEGEVFKMLEVGSPLGADPMEDVFIGESKETAKMLIENAVRCYPEKP